MAEVFVNKATYLLQNPSSGAVLTLQGVAGIPTSGTFRWRMGAEIMQHVSVNPSTNQITVIRATEGTARVEQPAGTALVPILSSAGMNAFLAAVPQTLRIPIALATVASSTPLPANAVIERGAVTIVTPYSAGATINVGQAGSTAEFMANADISPNPQTAGISVLEQDTPAGSTAPLLVTIGGAPSVGSGFVTVRYTVIPNT